MPKNPTKYNVKWEKDYKCITKGTDMYKALCKDCNITFSIKSGGKADINRHFKTEKHTRKFNDANISVSTVSENDISAIDDIDENNNEPELSREEEIRKAETIQALKVVSSNYSFASTVDDGERFRRMFPDSTIAQNYHQSSTKLSYVIKHGIAPYVKNVNIDDFKRTPFVFKFDETTTLQVKKTV